MLAKSPPPGLGHNHPPTTTHDLNAAPLENSAPTIPGPFSKWRFRDLVMTPEAIAMRASRAATDAGLSPVARIRVPLWVRDRAVAIMEAKHPAARDGKLTPEQFDVFLAQTYAEIIETALAPVPPTKPPRK